MFDAVNYLKYAAYADVWHSCPCMFLGVTLRSMPASGSTTMQKVLPEQVLQHLEEVLSSSSFVSSKRCQEFLRYVVVETVEGRGNLLKERNIAHDVFGKGSSFEPNEDALVRVKAREVRKRLVEYYESNADCPIRIDLPVGAYMPRISSKDESETPSEATGEKDKPAKHFLTRREMTMMLGGTVAGLGLASLAPFMHHSSSSLDGLWKPVFSSNNPLLIFIPVVDACDGQVSTLLGVGPTAALRKAAEFLTRHNYPYHLRFGPDLTYPQMIENPTLLLGGFASAWAMRIAQNLRFTLTWDESKDKIILDRNTGKTWRPLNQKPNGFADQDYGILSRLFDPASGQIVMIAAGILTFGTAGAAGLLFNPDWFDAFLKEAPKGWETKNFEAVIRVGVMGMATSTPQLIAANFW